MCERGDTSPAIRDGTGESHPGSTCVYPPRTHANKNICKTCRTIVKLTMGRRMCTHYCANRDNEFAADTVNKILGTVDAQDRYPPTVTYVRGLEEHPSRDVDETITELEAAIHPTRAPRTGLATPTWTTPRTARTRLQGRDKGRPTG